MLQLELRHRSAAHFERLWRQDLGLDAQQLDGLGALGEQRHGDGNLEELAVLLAIVRARCALLPTSGLVAHDSRR